MKVGILRKIQKIIEGINEDSKPEARNSELIEYIKEATRLNKDVFTCDNCAVNDCESWAEEGEGGYCSGFTMKWTHHFEWGLK
jgi:hypothetical protein